MAIAGIADPLRPRPPPLPSLLRLGFVGDCADEMLAEVAQPGAALHALPPDALDAVFTSVVRDPRGNDTVPGLVRLAQCALSCRLFRLAVRGVRTRFDADDVVITHEGEPIDDDHNFCAQRFVLERCNLGGEEAGVRFFSRDGERCAFLFRDVSNQFRRPVTFALARRRPHFNTHVCIELSLHDMMGAISYDSKNKLVDVDDTVPEQLVLHTPTSSVHFAQVGVTAEDTLIQKEVGEAALEVDSLNGVQLAVHGARTRSGPKFVVSHWPRDAWSGEPRYFEPAGGIWLDVPMGGSTLFTNSVFRLWEGAEKLVVAFGGLDALPLPPPRTRSNPLRAKKRAVDRPVPPVRGRRAAAIAADARLSVQMAAEACFHDGQMLPTSPLYAEKKAEEDKENAWRARRGLPPVFDQTLYRAPSGAPTPSPGASSSAPIVLESSDEEE